MAQYRGWRLATSLEFKEFDEFLLARALEHDSPTLLFRLACEYLISVRVIRSGPVSVLERVAHAREEASARPTTGARTSSPNRAAPAWTGYWWWTPRSGRPGCGG